MQAALLGHPQPGLGELLEELVVRRRSGGARGRSGGRARSACGRARSSRAGRRRTRRPPGVITRAISLSAATGSRKAVQGVATGGQREGAVGEGQRVEVGHGETRRCRRRPRGSGAAPRRSCPCGCRRPARWPPRRPARRPWCRPWCPRRWRGRRRSGAASSTTSSSEGSPCAVPCIVAHVARPPLSRS